MKVRTLLAALLSVALLPMAATALPRAMDTAAVAQDHDRDQDHDWDHDPRFQGHNQGFRMGFREGLDDGHHDREAGRRFHYGSGYKHTDHGYRDEFGNKNDYKREFRDGYVEGYREGYGEHH